MVSNVNYSIIHSFVFNLLVINPHNTLKYNLGESNKCLYSTRQLICVKYLNVSWMKDVDNASQTKTNVNVFSTVGGKAIIIIPIFLFLSSFKENQIGPLFKMILTKLCFLCIDILCAAILDLFLF